MNYLLDTNICIYYIKQKYNLESNFELFDGYNFNVSEITVAELLYGVEYSSRKQENYKKLKEFLSIFKIININNSLPLFAKEKARLRNMGLMIDNFDLLIGTSAVQNEMILVTNNVKHFSRISNIIIEDWTLR